MAPRKRKASAGTLSRLPFNWHLPIAPAVVDARPAADTPLLSRTAGPRVEATSVCALCRSSRCTACTGHVAWLQIGRCRSRHQGRFQGCSPGNLCTSIVCMLTLSVVLVVHYGGLGRTSISLGSDPLLTPLRPESIMAAIATLIQGGYRSVSVPNYVSVSR